MSSAYKPLFYDTCANYEYVCYVLGCIKFIFYSLIMNMYAKFRM
jgi:hypothetical protein